MPDQPETKPRSAVCDAIKVQHANMVRSQLDQIQALRGIAAFSILIAHTPYIQRGHFGVDLFFIVSGFIMTYVTEHTFERFLLKRAVRIVPLYWLGTLGVYA